MSDRQPFDMPKTGSWEQRGGWVVNRLAADLDLTPEQAAGLVGNLGYESQGFATLQEVKPAVVGSKGGYGWAQWTGPRRQAFESWARQRSLAVNTDEANYGFLVYELKGSQSGFLDRLRACPSLDRACRLTHTVYERPADVIDGSYRSYPDRLKWSERALNGAMDVADASTTDRDKLTNLVRHMQQVLGVTVDGVFGPQTAAALAKAQR